MNPAADDGGLCEHVVVCGLGHLGLRVVDLLVRLGRPVIALTRETDDREHGAVRSRLLQGDARDPALLSRAGIEQAASLITATGDDTTNVAIALEAQRLNPRLRLVIRLFDQRLAGHLERAFDLRRALSTSALAAPAFAAAALGERVLGAFEVDGASFLIEQRLGPASAAPLPQDADAVGLDTFSASTTIPGMTDVVVRRLPPRPIRRELSFARQPFRHARTVARSLLAGARAWWTEAPWLLRITLIGLLGMIATSVVLFHFALGLSMVDALYFVTSTVTTVGFGDLNLLSAPAPLKLYGVVLMLGSAALLAVLFSVVSDYLLRTRLRDVLAHGCIHDQGHVVVAGLGNIGYRVVDRLLRDGERVVAVERDPSGAFVDAARRRIPVILDDVRDIEALRRAGIAGARAVVAATDDDLTNLSIAVAALQARSDTRVILRLFDTRLAEKMHSALKIEAVLSTSSVAAPVFVASALDEQAIHAVVLGEALVIFFQRHCETAALSPARVDVGEGEVLLFSRRQGEKEFQPIIQSAPFSAGDAVIGARMLRLAPR